MRGMLRGTALARGIQSLAVAATLTACGGLPPIVEQPVQKAVDVTIVAAPAATAGAVPGVNIVELEVTQGVASQSNLIPGRATAVIARLESISGAVEVTGTLRIFNSGAAFSLEHPVAPAQLLSSGGGPAEGELVFEPLRLPNSSDIRFQVEARAVIDDALLAITDTTRAFTKAVVAPVLLYTPIHFTPSGQPAPQPAQIGAPNGNGFALSALPLPPMTGRYRGINEAGIESASPVAAEIIGVGDRGCVPTQSLNCIAIDGDGRLSLAEGAQVVFPRLSQLRQRVVIGPGLGMTELLFIHGWIRDDQPAFGNSSAVVELNGQAIRSGERVGYSTTSPDLGQLIYAHELLHNLSGRFGSAPADVNNAVPITTARGWDVATQLPGSWQGTGIAGQLKSEYYQIMAHRRSKESWVSEEEYDWALGYFGSDKLLKFVGELPTCEGASIRYGEPCLAEGNFVFSGAFGSVPLLPGQPVEAQLAAIFPVSRIPWRTQPTHTYSMFDFETARFALIFLKEEQEIERIQFDPTISTFADPEDVVANSSHDFLGYFEIVAPPWIVEAADRVDIEDTQTGQRWLFRGPGEQYPAGYPLESGEIIEPAPLSWPVEPTNQ